MPIGNVHRRQRRADWISRNSTDEKQMQMFLFCRRGSIGNVSKCNSHEKEQLLVVSKLLERRDVFAELPTRFGKSLTYQILPGVIKN